MLRERRRHANFKPNRKLDPKSSRSTIYENEELRLRTININAEVERGQSDIRKLRKENDQLRREIWALRDEYDRLDKILQATRNGRNILNQLNNAQLDSDAEGPRCDSCNQSESSCSSCDTSDDEHDGNGIVEQKPNLLNLPKAKERLHVNFDHLSIVSEETFTSSCENPSSPNIGENNTDTIKEESSEYNPDVCSALIDFQSIVPPLAYFENLCYEDIGPNLDASGEIHYSCESLNSKPTASMPSNGNKEVYPINQWNFSNRTQSESEIAKQGPDLFVQNGIPSCIRIQEPIYAEIRKKPASVFQVGGNLDDLLQNIEHLSQDIIQIQNENQKITSKYNMTTTTTEKPVINTTNSTLSTIQQAKPYRSEMNLMLSFDGNNPKIIPIENETNETTSANANKQDTPPPLIPNPMNLLPTTLPYIASDVRVSLSSNDTKCFERFTETKDCNYLETIRRKIFPRKSDTAKIVAKSSNGKLENDIAPNVEKLVEKSVNQKTQNGTEGTETKRKSRRVSLLFNGKKNVTGESQPKSENVISDLMSPQNKLKHFHRKVHRRHSDGNLLSRRESHESGMAIGRCSSRESSVSLKSQKSQKSQKPQKSRKASKSKSSNSSNVGKIPWFGCWGVECMY